MYNRDLEHWVNAADTPPHRHPDLPPDLEDDGADGQEGRDPGQGDQEAPVYWGPLQAPAPAHDPPQSLTRECLGEHIGNVPENNFIYLSPCLSS